MDAAQAPGRCAPPSPPPPEHVAAISYPATGRASKCDDSTIAVSDAVTPECRRHTGVPLLARRGAVRPCPARPTMAATAAAALVASLILGAGRCGAPCSVRRPERQRLVVDGGREWSSGALSINLRWITLSGKRVARNLGMRAFPGKHDHASIAAKLTEVLEEYGIYASSGDVATDKLIERFHGELPDEEEDASSPREEVDDTAPGSAAAAAAAAVLG